MILAGSNLMKYDSGAGGDDAADALRYLVASQPKRAGFAAG